MDRFHLLKVFIAVAEEQGFAAAARRLNMSPPAVTRAIAGLEQQLNVKLLNRTTRFVRATDVGLRYLDDARRILADLSAADEAVTGINAEPQGHLTVTAPVMFGSLFVMPTIVRYLQIHPKMEVSAIFLDRVVNMLEEGIDVGVRIGQLPDSSMRARRVGSVRLVLCASPQYIQIHGLPQHPDDLHQHTIIASKAGNNGLDWRFPDGKMIKSVKVKPRLTVTTNDAAISSAIEGLGITRLLSYQIAGQLASGELKILLEDYEPEPRPVHIIHREGPNGSAKVRSLVDLLAEQLTNDPALN
ncbi:LysR family transcriptional regulator [Shewanella eurypsychrophilus]|uniref:LysR family transcriptional regulator n=1 Tax=Shewanella eurypsychrophilus TaxID=2593656 RepID=A0ABX6V3Y4_9GAMM|nr:MULTISPECIES: LysR family transcriptional regulator [Shewanella]QFU21992.1 LysR family transcriptional regulator [Shewanella sp. YLB-09]QPG57281.1 LysR family transcriptional regulator [Shewanella eurypsychrophilus]